MGARAALGVVLEFARTDTPEDPHAFRFAPQDYTLRVADGRRARLTVPWDRALLAELAAVRSPSRDPAAAQRIGDRLRGILEPAGWGAIASQIHAAVEEGREVHVTVRSNAAELYALPWELMTLGPSGRHLGELEEVLLRHEWPGTKSTPEQPNPRTEGGRLLFAWSSAAGAVPVDDHLRAIDRACQEGHVAFNPERDVLAHAGVHGLTARLQSARDAGRPVAILHLLCHGAVAGATYGLTLDADDGEAVTVDAGRLRQLLAPFAGSLRLVVLAACDGGNAGDPGNHLGSIAQALHRAGIAAVVASRFPLSADGSGVLAAILYRALLVDLSSLERAFTRARLQLARDPTHLDWASLSLHARADDGDDTRPWIVRPYRGLLAFHAEHTRLFYGRDVERSEILSDLHALIEAGRPRFLVVAGASGTGKSSMVLAGAVPDLLRRGEAALRDEAATKLVARARRDLAAAAERMPGAYLRSALEALERGAAATVGGEWSCRVMRPGDRPMAALTSAIEGHTAGRRLLLVVDQFEELFTLSDDAKLREAFTRRLWSLSQGDSGVACVITIRVDFLGHCGHIVLDELGTRLDRVAYDEAHRVFVAQMEPAQLRAAIEEPARKLGLVLEPGLTERILADAGHEPGALPLIQYTLDRLWLQREGRVLTARAYEQLGGVGGALQQKADGIIDGLSDAEQRQVRRLMTRLVELGEEGVSTRRRVELTAVEPTDAEARAIFHDVLAQLVDARLLVRNDDAGATTIEVAHEALIRKWPRMSRWIEEDRDKIGQLETLEGWAREAAEQRSLLVGAQLGYATQVVARYPEDVDGRTIALVTASRARARRRQGALIGAVVLFAALGVVALILWQSSSANAVAAERSAEEAKTSAELADARAAEARRAQQAADKAGMRVRDGMRLSAAIGLEPGAPGLSMGLLREFEVEPPRAALGHAVLTARWSEQLQLTGHAGAVKSARFSSDGARVVTACEDGKVRVWSAHDGALLVDREVGPIGFALFRPDGAQILSALDDGTVHLWDGDPGHEDLILGSHEPRPADVTGGVSGPITIAVYSPDGAQVFTVRDENDRVQVWDARTGNEGPQIPAAQAVSVDFDRDARRVLVADRTGATVWDRSNLAVVTTLDVGVLTTARFARGGVVTLTGSHLLFWGLDRERPRRIVTLFDREDQPSLADITGPANVTQRPGAETLLITNRDASWLWSEPDPVTALKINDHAVGDARFSPDGAEIIALTRNIAGYPYRTPVVLNAEDHEDHRVLGGHRGAVLGLDVSPDGARVVTASEDGTARIWGANPRVEARFTSVLGGAPMRIQLSRDGAIQVYYDAADRAIKVHAMEGKGGASAEPSVPSPSAAYELALRSDGGQVAVAVAAEIALLEPSARAPARRWGINKGLRHLEYSADGTRLVGSFLGHVVIWNPATGAVVTDVDRRYARATIFAPDSTTRMASWSDASPEVTLWDAGTGETLHTLTHGEAIRTAAFAPSGDDLVVVTEANHMHLWDTRDGRARRRVGSAALAVSQIAIDPRGQWFVAACDDSTARIGSLGASEPGERDDTQVVLRGHTEPIVALAISPDGARVLTGSADQTARVWDTKSWRTIAVIKHRASLADVAFSSDSERTITISTDGALQVWSAKVPSDALRRELWAATRACPSIADREEYLSADHETAEIDARRCEAMVRCVHDREPGEYERCLAEFRRAQAAGAAFRAPDAVARAP